MLTISPQVGVMEGTEDYVTGFMYGADIKGIFPLGTTRVVSQLYIS